MREMTHRKLKTRKKSTVDPRLLDASEDVKSALADMELLPDEDVVLERELKDLGRKRKLRAERKC